MSRIKRHKFVIMVPCTIEFDSDLGQVDDTLIRLIKENLSDMGTSIGGGGYSIEFKKTPVRQLLLSCKEITKKK